MSERPVGEVLASIDQRLNDLAEDISEIKVQTIKTNGRVTGLETREAVAEGVRKARAEALQHEREKNAEAAAESDRKLNLKVMLGCAVIGSSSSLLGYGFVLLIQGHL